MEQDLHDIREQLAADLMKLPQDVRQELLAPYAEKYGSNATQADRKQTRQNYSQK